MPMTLQEIDAKLKACEQHNTQLTARKTMYAERLKKEFGVETTADLQTLLKQCEEQLAAKEREYNEALAKAEELLKAAGVSC